MKILEKILFLIFITNCADAAQRQKVLVGGLFHGGDDEQTQIAFRSAFDRVNFESVTHEFVVKMFNISRTGSFEAQQHVCQLASEGAQAFFGPGTVETTGIVSSIADKFEIPHIMYHWKTKPMWNLNAVNDHKMTHNFYPDADVLASAFRNVLVDYDWKTYTVVYENKENLIRLKQILEIHDSKSSAVAVRRLVDDDYGGLLKEINSRGDYNIILDIRSSKIVPFLKAAKDVNMLGDYNNYLITNLDTHTLDYSIVGEITSNITCLRLVEPISDETINAMRFWRQRHPHLSEMSEKQMTHEAGLVNDAVRLFAQSFQRYIVETGDETDFEEVKHDCKSVDGEPSESTFGKQFFEFFRKQSFQGATGEVKFNDGSEESNRGKRTEFQLEILEYSKGDYNMIGRWDPVNEVEYDREISDPEQQIQEKIQDKRFKVVAKYGVPFFNLREEVDGVILEGNARFEGYSVDLINKLAQEMKFQYTIEPVPDGQYGSKNKKTGKWDGMVKYLMERKADLGIADLTMTYERKTAVDFTSPFMSLGIGILYVKPVKKEKSLFSFLDPFTNDVWMYTGLSYIALSCVVFLLSRINNDDWESSHPCDQEPEEVESIWNILNCVWLSMGSIMGQGCDILPKGSSTRITTGFWFFFALIMLASYTANLAAFLTSDRLTNSISGAEDLAKQTKIKYGAVKEGSTIRFFQESNFSTFQRMWASMESNGDIVHTTSNPEGVERVKKENGKYAFMMESIPMEYVTERNCMLQLVGDLLDSKGYGIALPLNSPYRKAFSEALLKLSEKGVLNEIKDKWWKATDTKCVDEKPHDDLGIAETGGVFLVLIIGCLVALMIAIFEFMLNIEKIAVDEKIPPWEAFKSEISFALNFWIDTKPVRAKSSEGLVESRKSSLPRSLKSRSERFGSEPRSHAKKSTRSLNFDEGIHDSNSRSLLNLN